MIIARVEDCYPLKGHLVLGCSLLVEGMKEKADVVSLFDAGIALITPDGRNIRHRYSI